MEWKSRDDEISLNQAKDTLPPRANVMEFDVQTNKNDSEKNLKYRVAPVTYRTRSKGWSHNNGVCFVRMNSVGISGYFHSRLTQVFIHLSSVNHLDTVLMSLR